jgi:glycosyltransferase involved in cell wall biosynthesis
MRAGLFWTAVGLVAYTYVLFPILVVLRGLLAPRPHASRAIHPRVSIVIAARNEEAGIGAKLRSIDALDYPTDRIEVVVASDGSDDRTEEVVTTHPGRPVSLLSLPRRGKAPTLNAAVWATDGEILVFSDANSRFAPDAIRQIVEPFADPAVGGVAGNQVYDHGGAGRGDEGERAYWGFDRLLKWAESRSGHVISATGSIYAIRRELFEDIPDGVTDDFYTSVGVIARGRRLVFAPRAIAFEPTSGSSGREFRRKVRIITRGLSAVLARRELLDPRRFGFYSIQLFSHKVLRRTMAIPLVACALLSASLWGHGQIYRLAAVTQAVFYACAFVGLLPWRGARLRLFSLPAFMCSAIAASAAATWNVLRGHQIARWEPAHAEHDGG